MSSFVDTGKPTPHSLSAKADTRRRIRQTAATSVAVFCAVSLFLFLNGCSPKDPPTYTPVYKFGVQDNRSTTYSYQANGEPRYTQPGVNSGKPVTLKPIPSQRGFEPYDQVAEQVSMAFNADGTLPARYLTTSAKDGVVILSGTVPTAGDKARAEQIARRVAGVKELRSKIVISGGNRQ